MTSILLKNILFSVLLLVLFVNTQQFDVQNSIAYSNDLIDVSKIENKINSFDDYLRLSQFYVNKDLDSASYYGGNR